MAASRLLVGAGRWGKGRESRGKTSHLAADVYAADRGGVCKVALCAISTDSAVDSWSFQCLGGQHSSAGDAGDICAGLGLHVAQQAAASSNLGRVAHRAPCAWIQSVSLCLFCRLVQQSDMACDSMAHAVAADSPASG